MKSTLIAAITCGILCATSLAAAPLKLKPANPQPSSVKPGLAVVYAYPTDVKTLGNAKSALKAGAEPGKPLKGLDYWETLEGEKALTSKREHHVVARITGYVKFDAPGVYEVDFLSNDGLQGSIGGKEVVKYDERTPCESTGSKQVQAPSAGWYAIDLMYFQRLGASCLHMRRGPAGSEPDFVVDAAFGH
jgi:hypothetical protein